MNYKTKIGNINIKFVFRHKWDNEDKSKINPMFGEYRLGLLYKRNKIVGSKNFNNPKEWGNNLVNDYTIGVNLLIFKAWVSFNLDGKSL